MIHAKKRGLWPLHIYRPDHLATNLTWRWLWWPCAGGDTTQLGTYWDISLVPNVAILNIGFLVENLLCMVPARVAKIDASSTTFAYWWNVSQHRHSFSGPLIDSRRLSPDVFSSLHCIARDGMHLSYGTVHVTSGPIRRRNRQIGPHGWIL